jgi:NhaP-type Na+/H+ or K+/H+ antiporter
MVSGPVAALLAVGAALGVAFLASSAFRRTHVPDIVFLLLTGAALGPWLGVVNVDAVARVLPFLAALAIITILFDGALEVRPAQLKEFGAPSVGLSFAVATITTLIGGAVAHLVAGLPWSSSLLLGLCFGGAGIAIIVPLARRMGVSRGAGTVILLEAVTSDIFVIVGMFIACTVVASGAVGVELTLELLLHVALAVLIGPLAGWLWSRFLERWGEASNAYVATLAALLIVYGATEALSGSGPLAVLLFGLLVGNARSSKVKAGFARRVLPDQLIEFHHEIVFFVRAAFFVCMGVVARWDLLADVEFLQTGLLLAVAVALCRALGVALVLSRSSLSRWDKVATALLFPMGLATAAVSVVPRSFGIEGGEVIVAYAAVVIVLTNVLATLAVFAASALRPRSEAPGDPEAMG